MENVLSQDVKAQLTPSAVEPISADEQERFVSILNFWHKIEFFVPFDLDQRIAESDERKFRYLQRQDAARGPSLWQIEIPEDEEVKRFHLYLVVFDKAEITRACNRILGTSEDANDDEEFERTALEGRSCFAQLTIDPTGELILSSARSSPVSYVSTLPWALGQLEKAGLAALTFERFEKAKQDLAELLLNFKVSRGPLTYSDVLALHEMLQNWAGFSSPPANLMGVLETITGKKKKQEAAAEKPDDLDEAEATSEEPNSDIAILNSFFIQDIENAIQSIKSGSISRPLQEFLSPLPAAERVDLESAAGLRAVFEALHPARLNRGRWLSDADRSMTLMQQFAVSMIGRSSADAAALFSVNGPPGTGKTTFLQDAFADLIVCRARALAGLRTPRDAFLPHKLQVAFKGKQSRTISVLKPELTGFEMVVASSNNAAVENISGDLPKANKLGSEWQAAEYLKPVAYKIAAQQDDGSFKRLSDSDQPWGLVSCALGNSKNRKRFKERFCYMDVAKGQKAFWQIPERPQNIREWIDNYQGPDFRAAAASFVKKEAEVARNCDRLKPLADLLGDRLGGVHEERVSSARVRVEERRSEHLNLLQQKQETVAAIERLQNRLEDLHEEDRLLQRSRPGWWARLRRKSEAQLHAVQVAENVSTQLRTRRELRDLRTKHDDELHSRITWIASELGRLEAELKQAEAEKEAADQRFQTEQSKFACLTLPEKYWDLQSDSFQKAGLWRDDILAQQRSELFAAALSLHEAWLASVGRPRAGFRNNILAIADLLSGRRLENPADALAIWQSLFLMVPIVSTTFASFHNQFGDVGCASLGWLFIDEAGQAVPQAAVGAIWRAKRAVVIGDPLQIEPVFTLPSRFISAVAELSPHTADGSYSPHQTSVQRLADNANRFGVTLKGVDGDEVWVGSPLRVHFRCIEPMFSWSNEIAYNGKMILETPRRSEPSELAIPCESAWIDIKGNTRKRQEVPEQTEFVIELLLALYQRDRRLPDLYLISPFKAIKVELTKRILEADWVNQTKKSELKKWCKERIGTVHTFQGKEEDSVLMILGADWQRAGSADWACAKPNILNVALTRARRRFYLVGDRELWGARGPFAWSAGRVPTLSAGQFLTIAENALSQSVGR